LLEVKLSHIETNIREERKVTFSVTHERNLCFAFIFPVPEVTVNDIKKIDFLISFINTGLKKI